MTASKRIGFATRGDVLLRGDFFRAENANAPIVVMLGAMTTTSANSDRTAGCVGACRWRRRSHCSPQR
jgi:hypothetical protein